MIKTSVAALRPSSKVVRLGLRAARHDDYVWETSASRTASVLCDFGAALRRWPLWMRLGWQDVLLRYRRSLLGPFWLTLSMGIMIFMLSRIYGGLLHISALRYMPFLATGLITWTLINALVSEGCQTYIESDWLIRQIDLPLSMFPIRMVWRNMIVFSHHLVIYLLLLLIVPIRPGWALLAAVVGLAALLVNGLWFGALLGMLSARFRDLPQIVASLMQIAFFATPIIWSTEVMPGNDSMLWSFNPFYHLIEVVRAPALGGVPPLNSWIVVGSIALVGWIVTIVAFRQFYRRVCYWI